MTEDEGLDGDDGRAAADDLACALTRTFTVKQTGGD
jgi:hypothetical protein